jgi:hypothetical protein
MSQTTIWIPPQGEGLAVLTPIVNELLPALGANVGWQVALIAAAAVVVGILILAIALIMRRRAGRDDA